MPRAMKDNYLVRNALHRTVHLPVHWKAPITMTFIAVLSIVAWLDLSPQWTFLSDKNNVVNSLLVKWSWGWSLLCLIPSVLITASLYSGLQWREVVRHLSRLLVAHCVWFFTTQAFVSLDTAVGGCSDGSSRTRNKCLRQNSSWDGFDISGHVFLLTYCAYVLTEEVSGLRLEVWERFSGHSQLPPHLHTTLSPLAHCLELFAAALMTVWVVMTIATSLYFHSVLEKLLGGGCGWLAWLLTYDWLYGKRYMPRRPDHGLLYPQRPSHKN